MIDFKRKYYADGIFYYSVIKNGSEYTIEPMLNGKFLCAKYSLNMGLIGEKVEYSSLDDAFEHWESND